MPTTVPALRVSAAPPAARPTTGTPPPSSRPGRSARRAAAPPAPAGSAGTTTAQHVIDVHQHLWPPELIEALRGRQHPPRIDGWTLLLDGEPPYEVDPPITTRRGAAGLDRGRIVLGLSSPLGIEDLAADEGARRCSPPGTRGPRRCAPDFEAWASVSRRRPGPRRPRRPAGRRLRRAAGPGDLAATPARGGPAGRRAGGGRRRGPPGLRASRAGPAAGRPIRRLDVAAAAWWAAVVDYPEPVAGRLVVVACGRPARCSRTCGSASPPAPAWRRCTTSATWPAAAARWLSTRAPSSTPRRTPGRAWTA